MTGEKFRDTALRLIELDERVSQLIVEITDASWKRDSLAAEVERLCESIRPMLIDIGTDEYVRVGSHVFWLNGQGEVCFTRLRSWFELENLASLPDEPTEKVVSEDEPADAGDEIE